MHEERWKMTLDGVGDWRRHAAMADVADQVRRRNAKAWPTFGGVRAGPGTATASAVLCLFLLAAFLAVAVLDSGGGPKEGASGDQLRDYVEVNFAYSHKYAEALMDRLLLLADNVTATRSGVADANVAISQLDNTSPRKTHDLVVAMSDCMSCAAPAGETKPRPWYADRTVEVAEAAAEEVVAEDTAAEEVVAVVARPGVAEGLEVEELEVEEAEVEVDDSEVDSEEDDNNRN